MWLCLAASALTMTVIFSLGYCLGRVWENLFIPKRNKRSGLTVYAAEELHRHEASRKKGKHKVDGGDWVHDYDELFGDCESDAEIKVYLTKTGTKVHLLNCHGLHNADMSKMRTLAICKHCMKTRKERRLFHTD